MALNKELAAIKDAVDKDSGGGRDLDTARDLADKYVKAHPDKFAEYASPPADFKGTPIEFAVQAAEVFRAAGREESQWEAEAWLLHRFEPQNIGGTHQPQLRVVG